MLRLQTSDQHETQSGGGTYDSPTTCTATSALGTPMLTAMCSRRRLSFLAATDLGQNIDLGNANHPQPSNNAGPARWRRAAHRLPASRKGAWNTSPCRPHSLVKLATRRWVRRSWAAGAWCCEAGQGDARWHIAGPFSNRRAHYLRFYLAAFVGMHGDGHNSAHVALRVRFQGQHLGGGPFGARQANGAVSGRDCQAPSRKSSTIGLSAPWRATR